jgi:hypothetical protein
MTDEKDDELTAEHPAKRLMFRKRLLRMQAQTATAKAAQAAANARPRLAIWGRTFASPLPTAQQLQKAFNTPYGVPKLLIVPQWLQDRPTLPRRDPNKPLEFDHPILKAIHEIGTIKDVASALAWIRSVPAGMAQEHIYQRLQMGDLNGDAVAYFLSVYLEILDGVYPGWPCVDWEMARVVGKGDPLSIRQYAKEIYSADWGPFP